MKVKLKIIINLNLHSVKKIERFNCSFTFSSSVHAPQDDVLMEFEICLNFMIATHFTS